VAPPVGRVRTLPPVEPLLRPPIGFAHRGGRAHAPENTIEAFVLALRLGATGLESDVWRTADGVAVLHHGGAIRTGLRRRPIAELRRPQLPPHVPALDQLYEACGAGYELSLDVKDPAALAAVLGAARAAGSEAEGRLWLCHPEVEQLEAWRERTSGHLVTSTRLRRLRQGPERLAARLARAGIDAVNLPEADWTGGLTTLFHRFGRYALGWDAHFRRQLDALLGMGVDAVYSDNVDVMVDALAAAR
jgi:glycerophosphoryl diester phosphodiesterase